MLNLTFSDLQLAALLTKIGWVDVVALVLIFWGLVIGFKRGLEIELPKFLEAAVATVVTLHYYQAVGDILHVNLSAPTYPAQVLSFLGIALGCFLIVRLFFKILATLVTISFMGTVSRVGGALAGSLRFILAFSLLSFFLLMMPLDFFKDSFSFERSWSGPFFAQTSEKLYRLTTYYLPFKLGTPEIPTKSKEK